MPTEVLLIRDGTRLVAADPISAEAIAQLPLKDQFVCTIRRPRNPRHHRKFFVLLKVVFEAQSFYATEELLLDELKIAVGHCETITRSNGQTYIKPKSISFASMDQNSFDQIYQRIVYIILATILPAVSKTELERRVLDILDF